MFPNPEILGSHLGWYTLWHKIGIITTILFGLWYYHFKLKEKLSLLQLVLMITSFIVLGYIGAKSFSYLYSYLDSGANPFTNFSFKSFTKAKLRWYGALLLFISLTPIIGRAFKVKHFRSFLDAMAINFCLLNAIVKQGCFFSGDGCYGIYTNSIFGMYFPYGIVPNILPVHPTPLYDSIFHITLFGFLIWWNGKKKTFNGQTAILFFATTSIFNIGLEFIRTNPEVALGLNLSQLTYILILAVTIRYYFQFKKTSIPSITNLQIA